MHQSNFELLAACIVLPAGLQELQALGVHPAAYEGVGRQQVHDTPLTLASIPLAHLRSSEFRPLRTNWASPPQLRGFLSRTMGQAIAPRMTSSKPIATIIEVNPLAGASASCWSTVSAPQVPPPPAVTDWNVREKR
eukprot:scaffold1785_cov247-Pinguiococcus_pyrenoidosus.AAC.27